MGLPPRVHYVGVERGAGRWSRVDLCEGGGRRWAGAGRDVPPVMGAAPLRPVPRIYLLHRNHLRKYRPQLVEGAGCRGRGADCWVGVALVAPGRCRHQVLRIIL